MKVFKKGKNQFISVIYNIIKGNCTHGTSIYPFTTQAQIQTSKENKMFIIIEKIRFSQTNNGSVMAHYCCCYTTTGAK